MKFLRESRSFARVGSLVGVAVLVLGAAKVGWTAPADENCEAFKSLAAKAVEAMPAGVSAAKRAVQLVPATANVVFLAEVHTDRRAIVREAEMVTALHEQHGFDCLFIEMRKGFGVFSNLKPTPEGMTRARDELNARSYGEDFDAEILASGWLSAAYAAKKAGMKVFEYDDPTADDGMSVEDLMERNRTMAEILSQNMKSGQCTKSVALNGYWHTMLDSKPGPEPESQPESEEDSERVEDAMISLPTLVKKAGLAPHTIFLRSRGIEAYYPLLGKGCDYASVGGIEGYVIHESSATPHLFQEDLSDFARRHKLEYPQVTFDGSRSLVIF